VNAAQTPFVEWGSSEIRLDPIRLEALALQKLHRVERLQWLHLSGRDDVVRLEVVVRMGRFPLSLAVEIGELRILAGWVGFRLLRVEAPGGIGVPFGLLRLALERLEQIESRFVAEAKIVMVNLTPFLPRGAAVSLNDLRMEAGVLHVFLGPGLLPDLP